MERKEVFGRRLVKKAQCPFCGSPIERPKELPIRKWGEMPVGTCACGAVYACDVTGHNLGSAMVEALVFGCNMDWDLAWSLLPEDDYLEEVVENYDLVNNLVVPGGGFQGRRIYGALYFIRLHDDVLEVTADGVKRAMQKAVDVIDKPKNEKSRATTLTKRQVEDYVRDFQVNEILRVAKSDRRIVKKLQRLLYSGDDEFRMRAAEILGMVTAIIAEDNPSFISKILQTLFTSIVDTAASGWGAFEAIGEIISHKVDMFAGYIPNLYRFLPDVEKRVSALKAIGRIAEVRPDLVEKLSYYLLPLLDDPDYLTRGYAAWLLGSLGTREALGGLKKLETDTHEIDMYHNGRLTKKTVGEVALEAIDKI